MKRRKNIARLLSFLMVLSLLLGISAAPVYAVGGEGETASFEITEANGQTGTVQYSTGDGSVCSCCLHTSMVDNAHPLP